MSISGEFARVPKSTVFEQKAWAIAHGFENGRILEVLEIAPNSLKRLLTLANGFLTPARGGVVCVDFRRIRKGPKSTVFEQKAWAIAHGFEKVGFW